MRDVRSGPGRRVVAALAVALVAAGVSLAYAQQIWVGGGFGRGGRMAPHWAKPGDFDGSFLYCRGYYEQVRYEDGGMGWWTDYPNADHNFSVRLAGVYFAATEHDEDQPVHLRVLDTNICITRCVEEYDNPCTRFCPANVYEIVGEGSDKRLQINAANCVHCKTCDIKDPYEIITWVTPEGGAGPNYQNL